MSEARDNTVVIANVVGCQHCHQAIAIETPLPLDVAVTILRAFADLHQFCHLRQIFAADVVVGGEVESEVKE
ncbi:MAG: hypothetical protein U0350_36490 [Caldilineaceae bacterium]